MKYWAKRPNKDRSICQHSNKIEFIHPVTKKELSITAPNIATLSDRGGKEDKMREQLLSTAERGYQEREIKEELKIIPESPEWKKEKRVKKKQKSQWL